MATETLTGAISFINHEKGYATISYTIKGKKKTINGNISEREQLKLRSEKIIKKVHRFHVGDEVSFIIIPSAKGDKLIADCIAFRFNNAFDNLINKAAVENRFAGYLKKVGDDYFVKETGSYIFFPLKFSPWERKPPDNILNEPFFFRLENTYKPGKATAVPFISIYIPEYLTLKKHFQSKKPVEAVIDRVSAHAIFVRMLDKIQARIALSKNKQTLQEITLKEGDTIQVIITYIGSHRVIVEKVN